MKIIIKNRKSMPAHSPREIKYEFLIRTGGYLSYHVSSYIRTLENRIMRNEKNNQKSSYYL